MLRRAFLGLLLLVPILRADERPVVDDRSQVRERPANPALPTLWIAGDSTVKCPAPMRGWGQEIGAWLDPAKLNVANRAIGGRSSRTYFTEGRWEEILASLKKGDFVLIQFGHNDVGPIDARSKFRGSLKGTGDETAEVVKADGKTEVVHSFGWYLRHFARTAREKGATVILCSPVPHRDFDRDGHYREDWQEWRGWIQECARAEEAAFIDLAQLIGREYARLGPEGTKPLFADARTHSTPAGAKLNARIVAAALRQLPGDPMASLFLHP